MKRLYLFGLAFDRLIETGPQSWSLKFNNIKLIYKLDSQYK